jgi:hypothetical protein
VPIQPRARRRAFAVLAGSVVALATAAPTAAAPGPAVPPVVIVPPVLGHVWADQPATANYLAGTGYQYNSTGGPIEITRTGAGRYLVRFGGMGVSGGIAHAAAYGLAENGFCTIASWLKSGADEVLDVRCFDAAGAAADTRFVANFTNRAPAGGHVSYFWANLPVPAGPYQPAAQYRYDSSGTPVQVYRQSQGLYVVFSGAIDGAFPDIYDGHFQVTGYGTVPVHCEAAGPQDETPVPVVVACRDADGNLVDARFSFSYTRGYDVLAGSAPYGTARLRPDNITHVPYLEGWANAAGPPVVSWPATGRYLVRFPGLGTPRGHAIVDSSGSTSQTYCTVAGWWRSGADELVGVDCFGTAGNAPENSIVTVSFLVLGP